jgi:transcriptional regulator with XRE-family HTH domain
LLSRIRGLQILDHTFETHAMSASKTTATTIGRMCKQARLAIGLTQEGVAEATGVTADFYARIERGNSLPGLHTLMYLAAALHMTVDALLGLPAAGELSPDAELRGLLESASPGTLQVIEALLDALEEPRQ